MNGSLNHIMPSVNNIILGEKSPEGTVSPALVAKTGEMMEQHKSLQDGDPLKMTGSFNDIMLSMDQLNLGEISSGATVFSALVANTGEMSGAERIDIGSVLQSCSLPFTPSPSQTQSPVPPSAEADAEYVAPANLCRKPWVCKRKVRGARVSTPTPSPKQQPDEQHEAEQQPQPEQQLKAEQQQPQPEEQLQAEQLQPQPEQQPHDDPLIRAVLMIPTRTTTTATARGRKQDPLEDFIARARQRGLLPGLHSSLHLDSEGAFHLNT